MKHNISILFVLVFFLFTLNLPAVSQTLVWEAKLNQDGSLPQEWQGDREDYIVNKGFIRLNARPDRRTSFVYIPTRLNEDKAWQASLHLTHAPTQYNYSYILLAKIAEDNQERRYLALALGGRLSPRIRLCEAIFISRGGTYIHDKTRDIDLIQTKSLNESIYNNFSFHVQHRSHKYLSLYLSSHDPEELDLIGEVEYPIALKQDNELAIYSAFTSARRQGFACGMLRVLDPGKGENEAEESRESPTVQEEHKPNTSFILSEVMANPLVASPEYVELYHCGDVSTSIEGYRLALLGSDGLPRYYPLPPTIALLHPGEYYVFTSNPDALETAYPHIARERVYKMKLPQLRNAGFSMQLYHDRVLVDELTYDTNTWERGLRSKRGVSLERVEMSPLQRDFRPASKASGYATPTQENSQRHVVPSQSTSVDDDTHTLLASIIKRLEHEAGFSVEVKLYNFNGATLSSVAREESLSVLRAINAQPYQSLRQLVEYPQAIILVVYCKTSEGETEVYDLKFAFADF